MRSYETIVPCRRAAAMASRVICDVVSDRAAKMPPVWNQRTPSPAKRRSQSISPGASCEAAEWPRSETPRAGRNPKPRSVKFRPTRVECPRPSKSRHRICDTSTPPCRMQSSTRSPTSFLGRAVATVARRPNALRAARARLYSPPPSQIRNRRVLRMRSSPGSKRSITSPSAATSQRQASRRRRGSKGLVMSGPGWGWKEGFRA